MATLTIKIPNDAAIEVTEFIERIGGKVIKHTPDKPQAKVLIDKVEADLNKAFEVLEKNTKEIVFIEDLRNYMGVLQFANQNFNETPNTPPQSAPKKKRGDNNRQ